MKLWMFEDLPMAAETLAPLFEKNDWRWASLSTFRVPNSTEISDAMISLYGFLERRPDLEQITSGRLTAVRVQGREGQILIGLE